MKTIQVNVYEFNELTAEAQQVAIDNFLNDSDREYFWMSDNVDSIRKGLEFFDFRMISDYQIDYSSANRSYVGITSDHFYDEDLMNLSGVRLWKYINNNYMTYRCKYTKEVKPTLGGDCPFTGYCADENFLDKVREFMKRPTNITFEELMNDCVREVLEYIESDYDWQNSEEFAREELVGLELEFTEDGEIY